MRNLLTGLIPGACCLAISCAVVSCVDDTYDLTEDIDLTVNVGGDLTLPTSNTDVLTLSNIFDLDDNSSIREAADGEFGLKAGDYVLVQQGDRTNSDFRIGNVQINEPSRNTSASDVLEFVYAGIDKVTVAANPYINSIELKDDNVTRDLVSLSSAELNASILFSISYNSSTNFNGTAYIEEGYTATFDPSWYLELDESTTSFLELTNHNSIRFKQRAPISANSPLELKLRLVKVDLTQAPEGQGLYAPGHFYLTSAIESSGNISIDNWGNVAVGTVERLSIVTTTDLLSAVITKITGVVNPEITINDTEFTINDIPDFLSDDENSLDVANPRFYISVTNTSPVALELNARLSSYSNSNPATAFAEVGLGAAYGTKAVIVEAGGTTSILVSQLPLDVAGSENITVPNLSSLITTIPDFMKFHQVDCHAVQQPVTLELDPTYDFTTDYEVVMPLAFGEDMRLHYTHEDKEWDSDDLRKYNFNKALVSIVAENTLPLDMIPQVIGLNSRGEELTDITATVEGSVAAGSAANPASSTLSVTLESKTTSLAQLDGIKLIFDATSPANASLVGVNLNSEQSLRFAEIKVKIIGGVTVDLND